MIKQTYSVYLDLSTGRRTKWHLSKGCPIIDPGEDAITDIFLVAYYTQDTLDQLRTIDHYPQLAEIQVPDGAYKGARNPNRPAREMTSLGRPILHHPYIYQVNPAWFRWSPISNPFSNRRKMLIRLRSPHKNMVVIEKG